MRWRLHKVWWSVALVFSARAAFAAREAADLTVWLFSTAAVQTVQFEGGGARFRRCAECVTEVLSSPLMVTASGGRLSVQGRLASQTFVDGEVKATTGDGRVAQVAGRWTVFAGRDGMQVLVQVPSERYVMAVLQAEAAADEPVESLKALAVVVRSFAMQIPQRHGAEGLCDSTHCQALRFGRVPARVREAAEATAGETLWFGSGAAARQVSGYFAQNCGGMTEDAAAAWGGERKPWLPAHADPFCVRQPALWHAELSLEQVRDALRAEGLRTPGRVTAIQVVKTDVSGRVAELEIGDGGTAGEGPGLKPRFLQGAIQGPEGPCSLPPFDSKAAAPNPSPGLPASCSFLPVDAKTAARDVSPGLPASCSLPPVPWRAAGGNGLGLKPHGFGGVVQGPEGPCAHLPVSSNFQGTVRVPAATLRFALNRAYGWNELRSDEYRVRVVAGRVVFDGRGFGHGVGLCQAGARGMAAQGKGYREILGFYFPGTTVRVLARDSGWAWRQGNGWMLRAVSAGNEWARAGDAAWAKARSAFPGARVLMPQVTVYPTTELFRQATGEPGWELAATRGTMVAVQPEAVVTRRSCEPGSQKRDPGHPEFVDPPHRAKSGRDEWAAHGCGGPNYRDLSAAAATSAASDRDDKRFRSYEALEGLLLHEFLHVLVETEARAESPLWLREGLVEVLGGEARVAEAELGSQAQHGERAMRAAEIDAGLSRAGSWAESKQAHAAACARVRSAVNRFGMATVRGWLRNGVPAGVDLQ